MQTGNKFMNIDEENKTISNKNDSKFIRIIKKICITLTIIVAIFGCIIGIYYLINSHTIENIEYYGPFLRILSASLGFSFFIYTVAIIAIIWIIYGIILVLSKIYKTHKGLFTFVIITIIFLCLIILRNSNKKDIAEVLNNSPNSEFYNISSYYFIYNNKIYYYSLEHNNNFSKLYDRFYVMNLDGTDNRKLAETDELRYAHFYFVYNNEAYYYTTYYDDNKKIDLSTGRITSLGNKDIYLGKTLKDGVIYSFIDNSAFGNANSALRKIDLKNNTVLSEVITKYRVYHNKYVIDYDEGNIYYIEDSNSEHPSIYKNDEFIYEFSNYSKTTLPETQFIAADKSFVFFKQNQQIFKLNTDTRKIEATINYELEEFKRINGGNSSDNYFYSNNKIYSFNLNNNSFDLILDNIQKAPEYIYDMNNRIVFTENTDNLQNYVLGSVTIFDKTTNKVETINNVRKFSFDEEKLYLLIENNNNYIIEIH